LLEEPDQLLDEEPTRGEGLGRELTDLPVEQPTLGEVVQIGDRKRGGDSGETMR
jgi:hypothetical protein